MKKIIWNSILATLLGTLALCAVLVFACVCFFPPTVMEFAYSVGWESTAMKYAERSYNRFGDAYYIAYAMEIAADEELDEDTERYAESLIAHKDFVSYCEGIDAKSFYIDENGNRTDEKLKSTYKQHVYVNLCCGADVRTESGGYGNGGKNIRFAGRFRRFRAGSGGRGIPRRDEISDRSRGRAKRRLGRLITAEKNKKGDKNALFVCGNNQR